jgi:mercuric ion transport protein
MRPIGSIADKAGALGAVVSAMGCAACFPALGWLRHRQWHRSLLGMIGPAIVFVGTVWLFGNWWAAGVVYTGLALMVGVSIWDLVSPANRRCGPDSCELPAKHD